MAPRLFGHGHDVKAVFKYVLLPVLLVGMAGVLTLPDSEWFPRVEANAAMLADPPPAIDGQRAYGYLKQLVDIGPRTAGSEENTRQRKLVAEHFVKAGGKVDEQRFRAVHPVTGRGLAMANLVGSWHPDRLGRVVIGAHYDTRPHPDQEFDPMRQHLPFVGANDGGSGVALLMEIANHLSDLNTDWGVDLVLFDGEELVFGNDPRVGEYFLGSKEFARLYARQVSRKQTKMRYEAGIVLDMVGGRNLHLSQEPTSLHYAPQLVGDVWAVARSLGVKSFAFDRGREVMDDHLALNKVGIPTIDIIDFEYPFWHKADDLPENCSAESLADVGRVVTSWLLLPPRTRSRR